MDMKATLASTSMIFAVGSSSWMKKKIAPATNAKAARMDRVVYALTLFSQLVPLLIILGKINRFFSDLTHDDEGSKHVQVDVAKGDGHDTYEF